MVLRTCVAALSAAALVSSTVRASADEGVADDEPNAVLGLVAGGAITMTSLGVGATMVARADDRATRNAGLIGAQSGMVFAPLVAHLVVGETKRGLWYSLPLLIPVAVQSVVVATHPGALFRAPAPVQYTLFASALFSVFGSTIGVLDAARAGERKPKTSTGPTALVAPMLGGGTAGLFLTGSL